MKVQLHQLNVETEEVNRWFSSVCEDDEGGFTQLTDEQVMTLDRFIKHVDLMLGKEHWNESDIIKVEQH